MSNLPDDRFVEYLAWLITRDAEFIGTYYDAIIPNQFESNELVWFFTKAKDFYLENRGLIPREVLEILLDEDKQSKVDKSIVLTYYDEAPEPSEAMRSFMFKHARGWFQRRVMFSAMERAQDMLDENRLDAAKDLLAKAAVETAAVGQKDLGLALFDSVDMFNELMEEAYNPDTNNAVATGMRTIDWLLRGGLRPGELGLIMAKPGGGKSQSLGFMARNAMLNGYNVVFYTLEMSPLLVHQRIWAGILDIGTTEMERNLPLTKRLTMAAVEKLKADGAGELVVKEYPTASASIDDIIAHIDSLEKVADFKPDIIFVDYGDILAPRRSFNVRRDDLATVYQDLRGIGQIINVPVWTASQINREGADRSYVKLTDIADSWDKVKIADYIFAFSQTEIQKQNNEGELSPLKVRNNASQESIPVTVDFSRAIFHDHGTIRGSDE
jgi:replicative DNA helicase